MFCTAKRIVVILYHGLFNKKYIIFKTNYFPKLVLTRSHTNLLLYPSVTRTLNEYTCTHKFCNRSDDNRDVTTRNGNVSNDRVRN